MLHFITASDCRSRCVRFLLCKVLVMSLIIDFLRKNMREETFQAFLGAILKLIFRACVYGIKYFVFFNLEHFISEVVRK